MISQAQGIQREFINHINMNDSEWVMNLGQFDIEGINQRLEAIFNADFKALANRLNSRGLSHNYQRMLKDINYLIQQGFLHSNEKRQTPKTQIQFVLSRLIICRRVASQLLKQLEGLLNELKQTGSSLFSENSLNLSNLNTAFQMGKRIDQSKGYEREIQLVIEDYCHLLDGIYSLLGDARELYRGRADIYPFQIELAIRQLFVSTTESCEAGALMVRSLLEVIVRRVFFTLTPASDIVYVPKKSLDVPIILEYCRRHGLRFNYSNEIMNLVWENLNLVVHFGFKLSPAVLWYMFMIARTTLMVAERDENALRQKIREVLESLTVAGHIEKLDAQSLRSEGFTIYWRY